MTKHEIYFVATKIRDDGAILEREIWLVTCKKCKHWFSSNGEHGVCEYRRRKEGMPIGVDADDFCSRGEKK